MKGLAIVFYCMVYLGVNALNRPMNLYFPSCNANNTCSGAFAICCNITDGLLLNTKVCIN